MAKIRIRKYGYGNTGSSNLAHTKWNKLKTSVGIVLKAPFVRIKLSSKTIELRSHLPPTRLFEKIPEIQCFLHRERNLKDRQ